MQWNRLVFVRIKKVVLFHYYQYAHKSDVWHQIIMKRDNYWNYYVCILLGWNSSLSKHFVVLIKVMILEMNIFFFRNKKVCCTICKEDFKHEYDCMTRTQLNNLLVNILHYSTYIMEAYWGYILQYYHAQQNIAFLRNYIWVRIIKFYWPNFFKPTWNKVTKL